MHSCRCLRVHCSLLGQFQAKPKNVPHGTQPPLSTCQASCPETHHSKLLSSATGAVFAFLPSNLKTLGHCCSKTVVAHTKSPQPHHVAAVGGALGLVWGPDGLDGPVTFFFSLYKALRLYTPTKTGLYHAVSLVKTICYYTRL